MELTYSEYREATVALKISIAEAAAAIEVRPGTLEMEFRLRQNIDRLSPGQSRQARALLAARGASTSTDDGTAGGERSLYPERGTSSPEVTHEPFDLVDALSIPPRSMDYLWLDRVANGRLTLIAGYPDRGKSLLSSFMAARVTTGSAWPDSGQAAPVGKVLMLATEDDHETVVVPRLLAAGADLSRVKVLPPESISFGAEEFVGRLDATLQASHDVRLVILDPLLAMLRGISTAGNDRVRAVMEAVQTVAVRHGVAIVGIVHPNKRPSRQVSDALPGARALGAVVRTVWWVDNDPANPARKIMIPVMGRNGGASGLGFRVEVETVKDGISAARLVADGAPVRVTWADLVGDPEGTSALEDARRFIATELADGPLSSEELAARANAAGISKATLRRAEQGIVERRKSSSGPWVVQLVSAASKKLNATEDAHARDDEHLCEV